MMAWAGVLSVLVEEPDGLRWPVARALGEEQPAGHRARNRAARGRHRHGEGPGQLLHTKYTAFDTSSAEGSTGAGAQAVRAVVSSTDNRPAQLTIAPPSGANPPSPVHTLWIMASTEPGTEIPLRFYSVHIEAARAARPSSASPARGDEATVPEAPRARRLN
eukprot:COSAG01_NODE_15574_length_1322_cov_1.654129_2_plen_162_part_00